MKFRSFMFMQSSTITNHLIFVLMNTNMNNYTYTLIPTTLALMRTNRITGDSSQPFKSSDFSFALLKVLDALTLSEPILHFEVGKAVECRGKLKCLLLLGNFSWTAKLQSLLRAFKDTKVMPLLL